MSRLGQACNHVAALLFYLERHCGPNFDNLPTDLSRTSMPMTWHQVPRKSVTPTAVRDLTFVKHSHGADKEAPAASLSSSLKRSSFDPRRLQDRTVDEDSRVKLMADVLSSLPSSGMQQFWMKSNHVSLPEPPTISEDRLWSEVIFWHQNAAKVNPSKFFSPSVAQVEAFVAGMTLPAQVVSEIELSTRSQADSTLWLALHNGRITSSRFGEILRRRDDTDPKNLVKSLMGYRSSVGMSRGS